MQDIPHWPVIVLGAGPAGLSCSLFLAKAGYPHAIIDRSVQPRDKVCGESFDGKVYHILKRLQLLDRMYEEGVIQYSRAYRLSNGRGLDLRLQFPVGNTPRIQSRRRDFDTFLLQELRRYPSTEFIAGVQINRSAYQDGRRILYDRQGKAVASCDLLVHCAGTRTAHEGRRLLFWRAYYRLPRRSDATNCVEIHLLRKPHRSCLIYTPLPGDLCNVELGLELSALRQKRVTGATLLRQAIGQQAELSARLREASCLQPARGASMVLQDRPGTLWEPALLYAGASAFCVNPVTGLGVGNAMRMGELAAAHILSKPLETLCENRSLAAYSAQVHSALRSELRFSQAVTTLQRKAHWIEPILERTSHWPWLRRKLSSQGLVQDLGKFNPGS